MMENVDLPPPYSAFLDVSAASPDVLLSTEITPQEKVKKETKDEEPMVVRPFDNKDTRMGFIQKIMLHLFLQALSSLIIMVPFIYNWHGLQSVQSIYAYVFLFLYLVMMGILLTSHRARTTNPYKVILFVAYPVIFAVFISFSTLGYSIREMFVAWSCYCVTLFALLAYSILIFQTSLEYRPDGGTFISTVVLLSLYTLVTQFYELDKIFVAIYMIGMLVDCSYTAWDIHLITSPDYRHAVTASDIILGVLLIRIDLIYYILTCTKKCLVFIVGFKD